MIYREDESATIRRELEAAEAKAKEMSEALAARQQEIVRMTESLINLRRRDRLSNVLSTGGKVILGLFMVGVVLYGIGSAIQSCEAEEPPISAGVITDRYDDPEYTTPAYTTTICSGSGRSRICVPLHHPPVVHPEVWSIRVAHDGRERVIRMTSQSWERTAIGDTWCEHTPCDPLPTVERNR